MDPNRFQPMNVQEFSYPGQPSTPSLITSSDSSIAPSTRITSARSEWTSQTRGVWVPLSKAANPAEFSIGQIIYSPCSIENSIKQAATARERSIAKQRYEQFVEHDLIPYNKVRPCVVLLIRQEQEDPLIVAPITHHDHVDWKKLKSPHQEFSFPIDNPAFHDQGMAAHFKELPFKFNPPFTETSPQYIVAVRIASDLMFVREADRPKWQRHLPTDEVERLLECCERLVPLQSNTQSPTLEGFERVVTRKKPKRPVRIVSL